MAPTKTRLENFPTISHKSIDGSDCEGAIGCEGSIRPEARGSYVALRCGGCGAVLGAIDPDLLMKLVEPRLQTSAKP